MTTAPALRDLFAEPAVIEPNGCGVCPEHAVEVLTLPNPRKGWRGLPLAEIRLLNIVDGHGGWIWFYGTGMSLPEGGYGGPLMAGPRGGRRFRGDALAAAVAQVRGHAEAQVGHATDTHARQARAVLGWLEGLEI